MNLPPFVTRLTARLAFLASLFFALGSWPSAMLVTTLASMNGEASSLLGREESELGDEDVALHRHGAHEERRAERAAPPWAGGGGELRVARAVPFVPPQRVTKAPPRLPYRPLLRLLV